MSSSQNTANYNKNNLPHQNDQYKNNVKPQETFIQKITLVLYIQNLSQSILNRT